MVRPGTGCRGGRGLSALRQQLSALGQAAPQGLGRQLAHPRCTADPGPAPPPTPPPARREAVRPQAPPLRFQVGRGRGWMEKAFTGSALCAAGPAVDQTKGWKRFRPFCCGLRGPTHQAAARAAARGGGGGGQGFIRVGTLPATERGGVRLEGGGLLTPPSRAPLWLPLAVEASPASVGFSAPSLL